MSSGSGSVAHEQIILGRDSPQALSSADAWGSPSSTSDQREGAWGRRWAGGSPVSPGFGGWRGAFPTPNLNANTPQPIRVPRDAAYYASMAEQDAQDRSTVFGPAMLERSERLPRGQSVDTNTMPPYDPAVVHLRDYAPHERGCKMTATETNVPDRFELFLLGPGEKKVTVTPDTRIPSSALFTFHKEDHTLGNLLRARLLTSPHVTFAGYKVPHPLFPDFELRVQTDGEITPKDALVVACRDVVQDLGALGREFTKEWELKKMIGDGGQAGGN